MVGTRFLRRLASCTEQKIYVYIEYEEIVLFIYIYYPYLIYCIEVWGISPHTHLKPSHNCRKRLLEL